MSMCRLGMLLLLSDNTWSTRQYFPKNDMYSNSSTPWTLFSLNCCVEVYGNNLIYDQIDSRRAEMCFINVPITFFVF